MHARALAATGGALIAIAVAAAPAGALPTRTSTTSDTKSWCAAVIRVNTKYGTMRNKHYLAPGKFLLGAWKGVIDETLANRGKYLAITPPAIKTAVKDEIAWFARVKANRYSPRTPLAPLTVAEAKQLTRFQEKYCGITFDTR